MKIIIDTHTHTVASCHAYSTVQELAKEAGTNGIQMIAVTDHGPAMKGAPDLWYFGNLTVLPSSIYGIRVLRGAEANIIQYNGEVDITEAYLKKLEFVIASFHDYCIEPSTINTNTGAMINALKNPYIDAVGHPGNPQFQVDIESVVASAKKYNKLIEINNHSSVVREGSEENCKEFAVQCKKQGVRIVCGSDAHISFRVGLFDNVYKLLEEVGMPEELVLNASMDRFTEYLKERQNRIK